MWNAIILIKKIWYWVLWHWLSFSILAWLPNWVWCPDIGCHWSWSLKLIGFIGFMMKNCLHYLEYFRAIYRCKILFGCTEFSKGLIKIPRKPGLNLCCVCVVGFVFHITLYHHNHISRWQHYLAGCLCDVTLFLMFNIQRITWHICNIPWSFIYL